ncbi:recombinase family protein [Ensifer sp. ENS02]|nr:recombinase family protein [Ensifer sp. ENS02]
MDGTDSNIDSAATPWRNKPTPVAIYCRTAQQSETAVNHQRTACQEYAHDMGWSVTDCFVDNGYSGLSASRPGLKSMRRAAKRAFPPFQIIIVADRARLYRNREKFASLVSWFTEHGIELWTLDGPVGFARPDAERQMTRFGVPQSVGRIQEVTLDLARLIGRQLARETWKRSDRNR